MDPPGPEWTPGNRDCLGHQGRGAGVDCHFGPSESQKDWPFLTGSGP
jgi:hypothetical protein